MTSQLNSTLKNSSLIREGVTILGEKPLPKQPLDSRRENNLTPHVSVISEEEEDRPWEQSKPQLISIRWAWRKGGLKLEVRILEPGLGARGVGINGR
jgi:hypothetical protein